MNKKYITQVNESSNNLNLYCSKKNSTLQFKKVKVKTNRIDFINSLTQASERDTLMKKRHNWYKQKRLRILKETYEQNCRLYMSLNQQKSSYTCPKLPPYSKNNLKIINSGRKQKENLRYTEPIQQATNNKRNILFLQRFNTNKQLSSIQNKKLNNLPVLKPSKSSLVSFLLSNTLKKYKTRQQ